MDVPDVHVLERWMRDPEIRDVLVATVISGYAFHRANNVQ